MPHEALPSFAAWSGPHDARCVIVGEAWGAGEDRTRRPFSHESGKELWRMLGEAWPEVASEEHARVSDLHRYGLAWVGQRDGWLSTASLAFTNVLAFRPPGNKIPEVCCRKAELPSGYTWPSLRTGFYLRPEYLPELDRLFAELAACRPNLVIAMGNTACWALLGQTNISQIRGAITQARLPDGTTLKILPTYHPASLLYENVWKWRPIIIADLMKALHEIDSPEIRRPRRRILHSPTLDEVRQFVARTLAAPPERLSCDTETSLGLIDTISFSASPDSGFVCQVGPHRFKRGQRYVTVWPERNGERRTSYWDLDEEIEFWNLCFDLLESPIPKIGQNFLYDIQYLLRAGCRPRACQDDLMLLHHALYPEMQKGLGFLGSIYTNEPAWKLMRRSSQGGDSEKRDE